jgi:hypothetical protein
MYRRPLALELTLPIKRPEGNWDPFWNVVYFVDEEILSGQGAKGKLKAIPCSLRTLRAPGNEIQFSPCAIR